MPVLLAFVPQCAKRSGIECPRALPKMLIEENRDAPPSTPFYSCLKNLSNAEIQEFILTRHAIVQ